MNFTCLSRNIALAFLIASTITGCQKPPPPPPPDRPPPAVSTVPVTTKDIPVYLDEIGKCAAPEVVSVLPQVSGQITDLFFNEGADLKEGDKLFTIDPRPIQAQIDQVKAELALNHASLEQSEATLAQHKAALDQMKAELSQSKSRLELYNMEFERAKNLFENKAGSRQDYDSKQMTAVVGKAQVEASAAAVAVAEAQLKQSTAAVSMAKAKINASEATIKMHEINLGYTKIVSPIAGRAGQKLVDKGNVVNHTAASPMLVIQKLDPIYIDFIVPERELSKVRTSLKAGQLKVECRSPDAPNEMKTGEVFFIDNAVQESTGTVKLRAKVINADHYFWPGQFVKVRLVMGTRKDAVLVPAVATQIGQIGTYVYVVKEDSTAELRPVKIGQRHGDLVAIDEGLKSGENIILSGQLMVIPGTKVSVKPPETKVTMKDGAKE